MPLAEAEIRPRKAHFELKTAETILEDIRHALGDQSPKSAAARGIVLQHLRKALSEARKSAEAELVETGRGTRCAANLCSAEDEIIRAAHHFAVREVYPVDNPSGA